MKLLTSAVQTALVCAALFTCVSNTLADDRHSVVYEGTDGIGQGKHIVFLASDHEYRSEESMPALAKILAKHHGFRCTVVFGIDSESGEIVAGSSDVGGLDALDDADLFVIFARFLDPPASEMDHLAKYLRKGGPVVGFRTATHSFKIPHDKPYGRFDWKYEGEDFPGGFGRQILGETWISHYGTNHVQSSRMSLKEEGESHPIGRGVNNMHVAAGGYFIDEDKLENATGLAMVQPLLSMKPDGEADPEKPAVVGAWTREYQFEGGPKGRVFATTNGASEDMLNDGFRRLSINGILWAAGMEDEITSDLNIDFVGEYRPSTFSHLGYRIGVKPADLAGFDSVILPGETNPESRYLKKQKQKTKKAQKSAE
ncbi:ThuA domain-containing protein [Calycomorphotria hydatis]|uniref:Trehalose utilization n=1 Tax=Calycomorphotria hydatis TaxID=2528027 RepID=A0A517T473_9PLAN|nr:ThuA domain-containing protein [Calycomorphotria hydatis]QDT63175.1 Trehalose utilization [Calycomorphotria hydatis]